MAEIEQLKLEKKLAIEESELKYYNSKSSLD